jgi:REP element-mobilizing transposase RayT
MKKSPTRKPNRLRGYDYSQNGAYFITICTKNRAELFGEINVGAAICRPTIQLSNAGKMVDESIRKIPQIYSCASIEAYVIMPNHVHLILSLNQTNGRQVAAPTTVSVCDIIANMKRAVSIHIGFSPWQKSYHDHIIRNEQDYNRIAEYIANNPTKWQNDCFHPSSP